MKLTIIGAGPGGYSAAFAAAKAGVEVTLVERAKLGGTCLHTGCIPTKTLRSSADVLEMSGRLAEFGITGECALKADMPAIVNRKRKVTATLQTGLEKTCAQLKVRVVYGKAELVSAKLVRVTTAEGTEEVESDNVIIATGSSPLELPARPVDHARVLSSDDALELQAVPPSLIIVGGGVIGCELAFIYRAFGSKVTVVEGQNRVLPLPSVDEEISRLLQREMKKKGIAVELVRTVTATTPTGTGVSVEIGASPFVEVANPPAPRTLEADAVCVTVGRVPHTDGLGLDAAGVKVDARGWIEADDFLETSVPGVYAIGDVIGPRRIMLAHMAIAEAHTAVHNILHPEDRKAQRYDVVPSAIFTAPEIGDVGLSEAQAKQQGFTVKTSVFQFRELGKAQAMGELAGLFKLVVEEGSGKLLGAHIAGAHASDLIAEATLAIQRGCTARDLFETIHAHPTLSEGIYEAAGSLVEPPSDPAAGTSLKAAAPLSSPGAAAFLCAAPSDSLGGTAFRAVRRGEYTGTESGYNRFAPYMGTPHRRRIAL